ncbi:hypothetical protein, partial [Pseudomonas sp.]|uniref:hypothetical protein n=1 Tax=Pseudomonas sp. TaxID=306 RepID=UPI003BB5583F
MTARTDSHNDSLISSATANSPSTPHFNILAIYTSLSGRKFSPAIIIAAAYQPDGQYVTTAAMLYPGYLA